MFRKKLWLGFTFLAVVAACDSTTGPNARQVGLSFSGVRPAGVAPGVAQGGAGLMANALGDSLSITDGTNTLIITRVELVAREIELRRVGVASCDSLGSDDDDCEEFSVDARLVVLPLLAGATQVLTIEVPAGTYSAFEMEVHKVSDDSGDVAFLAANPTWPEDQSLRVTGFYNGTPFTYVSDVNFEVEEDLSPPLVVDAAVAQNLTVRIDVTVWFRNGATGPLIDPATAGPSGPNKSLVENNIKDSVKAFRDDDRDGDERDG